MRKVPHYGIMPLHYKFDEWLKNKYADELFNSFCLSTVQSMQRPKSLAQKADTMNSEWLCITCTQ